MAKTTNFLSIALLVSVLAVSPVFAAGEPAANQPANPPANQAPAPAPVPAQPAEQAQAPVQEPAAGQAPVQAQDNAAPVVKGAALFAAVDYLNPFEYGKTTQGNYPTVAKTAKYLAVLGLVASNSTVLAAFSALIGAVQSACGAADEDADQSDDSEPTRLTIGRQA